MCPIGLARSSANLFDLSNEKGFLLNLLILGVAFDLRVNNWLAEILRPFETEPTRDNDYVHPTR